MVKRNISSKKRLPVVIFMYFYIGIVYEKAIVKHVKREDWYMWAHMSKGGITLPMFTSLDAYWPGIQVIYY